MAQYEPVYRQSHALVIGINDYQHLPPLATARPDAEAVAKALGERYQFDHVITLLDQNANKAAIEDSISELRASAGPDDRLVFYFAGHGIGLEGNIRVEGWLCAWDSDPQRHSRLIRMADVVDSNYTKAKHALAILDSCHSGLAVAYEHPRAAGSPTAGRAPAINHYLTRKAYQVISSANPLETATDAGMVDGHTPFTGYLLRALSGDEGARSPTSGLLTTDSLAQYIRDQLAAYSRNWQGPQLGILPGDGGGSLVWGPLDAKDLLPEWIAKTLRNEDPDVRRMAVGEVAALLSNPQFSAPARETLEGLIVNDPDQAVRQKAQSALRPAGPAAPPPPPPPISTPPMPPQSSAQTQKFSRLPAPAAKPSMLERWWRPVVIFATGLVVIMVYAIVYSIAYIFYDALRVAAFPGAVVQGLIALGHAVKKRWFQAIIYALPAGFGILTTLSDQASSSQIERLFYLFFFAYAGAFGWSVFRAFYEPNKAVGPNPPALKVEPSSQLQLKTPFYRRWWRATLLVIGGAAVFYWGLTASEANVLLLGLFALTAVVTVNHMIHKRWLHVTGYGVVCAAALLTAWINAAFPPELLAAFSCGMTFLAYMGLALWAVVDALRNQSV
jgi:hypothetical protein